jgi:hypothetical protein
MLKPKTYAAITSIIFALVAILHLVRILAGWDFTIGGWNVPTWLSLIGVVVPGILAIVGFRLSK